MGKYQIIIEGEGPHHSGGPNDADDGAKSLVVGLKMAGHTVTRAEIKCDGRPEDINIDPPSFDDDEPVGPGPTDPTHGSMTASGPPPDETSSEDAPTGDASSPADNGGGPPTD